MSYGFPQRAPGCSLTRACLRRRRTRCGRRRSGGWRCSTTRSAPSSRLRSPSLTLPTASPFRSLLQPQIKSFLKRHFQYFAEELDHPPPGARRSAGARGPAGVRDRRAAPPRKHAPQGAPPLPSTCIACFFFVVAVARCCCLLLFVFFLVQRLRTADVRSRLFERVSRQL